jgi:hypothetical protein
MKFLPSGIRIILNLLFYIIYSIILIFLTGFILTNILNISYQDPDKIWYVVLVFVLIITFIFRKFFYISLKNN